MMESAYTLEGGGQALVLLPDAAQTPDALAELSSALHAGGLTVSVPALELGARPWRESITSARAAFVHLRERRGRRWDVDVLFLRYLPADDVRRIGEAHFGVGEGFLRRVDEVVDRLFRIRH